MKPSVTHRPALRRAVPVLLASVLTGGYSSSALAADAVNASTVSPTLQISVTVQKAIRLTLSQGTSGSACTVVDTGNYSMNFGNVDALGITAPSCGAKFNPTTAGTTPSAYYTDYQVTPVFSNQTTTSATVSAYVSTNFATLNNVLAVVQSNSAPAAIGGLAAMSTNAGAPTSIGTALASGTAVTRYIGVTVQPTNSTSAAVSGTDTATVTYTMTVP